VANAGLPKTKRSEELVWQLLDPLGGHSLRNETQRYRSRDDRVRKNAAGVATPSPVLLRTASVKCSVLRVSSQSGLLAMAERSTGTSAAAQVTTCSPKCLRGIGDHLRIRLVSRGDDSVQSARPPLEAGGAPRGATDSLRPHREQPPPEPFAEPRRTQSSLVGICYRSRIDPDDMPLQSIPMLGLKPRRQ
jgi:hypothetical protein